MALRNTATHYGSVAKWFHWTVALLILSMIPLGSIANDMASQIKAGNTDAAFVARTAMLFSLHKTVGVLVFLLALARILWALTNTKPLSLNGDNLLEHSLASAVHWLLYGSLVLVPLSGWIHHAATSGFAPIWLPIGQSLPLVPQSESVAAFFGGLHIVLVRVMVLSILLHFAGAAKHLIIDRDKTLARMLPGIPDIQAIPEQIKTRLPGIFAVATWAVALVLGGVFGMYGKHDQATAATATLEAVASEWSVETGSIGISVVQFGSTVEGGFADWTSQISFDPAPGAGTKGRVETTINIASLSLGSVAGQAMGPDFFATDQFPTATYSGDITLDENGTYSSSGTLSMKGTELPLSFPFELNLVDNTAEMSAQFDLMRLDYGIGQSMADESSLGFPVTVTLNLTASRAP
ncbi:MAG: cytochrome b/b6 domain-containing protein [Pseudomonadota bacterium]